MHTCAFKSIDHVLVRVKNAPLMMDLFATKLGLPVSWPLQTNDFATYRAGNVDKIESIVVGVR